MRRCPRPDLTGHLQLNARLERNMPTRAIVVLSLVVVLSGATVVLWLKDSTPASGNAVVVDVQRVGADELAHMEAVVPVELRQVVRPLEAATPSEPPMPASSGQAASGMDPAVGSDLPHVPRGDNTHRLFVDPLVFEQRYADANVEELVLAKQQVETELFQRLPEAIDDVYARGLYDEEVRAAPTGELTFSDPKPGHGLHNVSRTEVLGNGQRLVKRAVVPWEDYRGVYDLNDEVNWLSRRIRDEKRAAREEQ